MLPGREAQAEAGAAAVLAGAAAAPPAVEVRGEAVAHPVPRHPLPQGPARPADHPGVLEVPTTLETAEDPAAGGPLEMALRGVRAEAPPPATPVLPPTTPAARPPRDAPTGAAPRASAEVLKAPPVPGAVLLPTNALPPPPAARMLRLAVRLARAAPNSRAAATRSATLNPSTRRTIPLPSRKNPPHAPLTFRKPSRSTTGLILSSTIPEEAATGTGTAEAGAHTKSSEMPSCWAP